MGVFVSSQTHVTRKPVANCWRGIQKFGTKVVATNSEQKTCAMGLAILCNVSRSFSRPSPTDCLALPKGTEAVQYAAVFER